MSCARCISGWPMHMTELAVAGVIAGLGLIAAAAGSPLTLLVFRLVDRRDDPPAGEGPGSAPSTTGDPATSPEILADPGRPMSSDRAAPGSMRAAGSTLRGGLWIGILERVAVYATLVAGWPEGLAIILAVKGLGRYPELRARLDPGIAERFIIGTFTSVLSACACAGLALLVRAQLG